MIEALGAIAPGRPLREGLDRVLQSSKGALVVVGDGPEVLGICSGGFLLDADFTPQRFSELAKMDGAIIVASDASRIARANVHLVPNPNVPTTETGTRHRTAERVARSIDVPVISVSEDLAVITLYRRDQKHALDPIARLLSRANQALQTLERYRTRLDAVTSSLSALEIEDLVSLRDVVTVLQRAEMVRRIADEVAGYIVELGTDGRLIRLQLEEMMAGVNDDRRQVVLDYLPVGSDNEGAGAAASRTDTSLTGSDGRVDATQGINRWDGGSQGEELSPDGVSSGRAEAVMAALSGMSTDQLLVPDAVASVLGLPENVDLDTGVQPRGYRLLTKIPRLPNPVVRSIVSRYGNLQKLLRASAEDLDGIEGIELVNARAVKEGLDRLAESSILDRYN